METYIGRTKDVGELAIPCYTVMAVCRASCSRLMILVLVGIGWKYAIYQ